MGEDGTASLPCPGHNSTPKSGQIFLKPCKAKQAIWCRGWFCPWGGQVSGAGSTLSPPEASAGAAPTLPRKMPRLGDAGSRVQSHGVRQQGLFCPRTEQQDLVCNLGIPPPSQGARGWRLIPSQLSRGAGLCLEMLQETWLCCARLCHARLCLRLFCWVGFDQEQSVLELSPGSS